jgi:hypothetical protein
MSEGSCSVCSRAISGAEVLYTPQANLICPACNAESELRQLDVRAANNITNSGISSLLLALGSFFLNPYFVFSVMSVTAALYALRSFDESNRRFFQHVESKRGLIIACAVTALVLTAVNVLLFFVRFLPAR